MAISISEPFSPERPSASRRRPFCLWPRVPDKIVACGCAPRWNSVHGRRTTGFRRVSAAPHVAAAEDGQWPQSFPVSYLNNSHAPIRNDITINATVRSPVRSQIMRISCVWTDSSTTSRGFESRAHEGTLSAAAVAVALVRRAQARRLPAKRGEVIRTRCAFAIQISNSPMGLMVRDAASRLLTMRVRARATCSHLILRA